MVKLRDHYFIAWLNTEKNIEYVIKNKNIYVDMSTKEYTVYLDEYKKTIKPILKKVRNIIKELNTDI